MRQFYITFENIGPVAQYLNWTIICKLLSIKDENKRNYYINMCIKKNLSKRNLIELIKSNAYERLSIKNKENISIITKEKDLTISDILKNPIYIEVERSIDKISEKLLQELIIEKLESVLLELGHGFMYGGKEVKLGESYFLCYFLIQN